jgi:hypothetical protein
LGHPVCICTPSIFHAPRFSIYVQLKRHSNSNNMLDVSFFLYTLYLYTNQAGGLGKSRGWERAYFAGKSLHKISVLKGQCQLQCIARSNNAWRPFYWQSNSCFGFQSVIYFNHPMVILAHFNRIVTTKHQRNVYNRYLLTFHHFQGKM